MNKPELYNAVKASPTAQNIACLEDHGNKIKFNKEKNRIMDLGCGDGSFTRLLRTKYIPNNYEIIACDISENMVNYAKERYENENTKFRLWDIQTDVPREFTEAFDHVLSFLTFHWIPDQEKAFKNTYDLLVEGGDCLLTIIGYLPIYEIYLILSQTEKWRSWLEKINSVTFISPYHSSQNPQNQITEIMKKIGYKNIDVQCNKKKFSFNSVDEFKVLVKSLEPFGMPDDVFEDFMLDFLETSRSIKGFNIKKTGLDGPESVEYNYRLIVVYGSK